jgi:hypothetical protein
MSILDDYVKLHTEDVFKRAASRIVFRRSGKASHPSWPDLFRPSTSFLATLSDKRVVQIIPIRIFAVYQAHLPGTRPMLDVVSR